MFDSWTLKAFVALADRHKFRFLQPAMSINILITMALSKTNSNQLYNVTIFYFLFHYFFLISITTLAKLALTIPFNSIKEALNRIFYFYCTFFLSFFNLCSSLSMKLHFFSLKNIFKGFIRSSNMIQSTIEVY